MKKVLLIIALVFNCLANAQNLHPLQEVDPIWIIIVKIIVGLCVGTAFFLIIHGVARMPEEKPILINAEIVFRENSKAELKGDFEVLQEEFYTHVETGAMFFEKDILYIKNKKVIKKTINE